VRLGPGEAEFAMTIEAARHSAMGRAFASGLRADETFTTAKAKANFLRPMWQGEIPAAARVLWHGCTIGLVERDGRDERGRAAAHLTSTGMVPRGEGAAGR
jgi:acyl-coenzyme A thioesterase PaaI-like protein